MNEEKMNEEKQNIKDVFGCLLFTVLLVLLSPILLIIWLVELLQTPFKRRKYKQSPYFQKTQKPYTMFCTDRKPYLLYNLIAENTLPIDYFEEEYTEFFAFGETLLIPLPDSCSVNFDEEKKEWEIDTQDQDQKETETPIPQFFEETMQKIASLENPRSFKNAFLILESSVFHDDLTKHPAPYFIVYQDKSDLASTLHLLVDGVAPNSSPRLHEMTLQPHPFAMISQGKKTFELRLNDEKRRAISVGDTIRFTNAQDPSATLTVTVTSLAPFPSFADLYAALPLDKCGYTKEELAGASPDDMLAYYTKEEEAKYGVLAIGITL